jgi:hypothetical protein
MFKVTSIVEFINEALLPAKFKIKILDTLFTVLRTTHLREIRNGDNKTKDFKMSVDKYQNLINLIKDKVHLNRVYTITWIYEDTSNAISLEVTVDKIIVFGAIMRSNKNYTKLYPKAINRIHLDNKPF